jgi:hypothetical protein
MIRSAMANSDSNVVLRHEADAGCVGALSGRAKDDG